MRDQESHNGPGRKRKVYVEKKELCGLYSRVGWTVVYKGEKKKAKVCPGTAAHACNPWLRQTDPVSSGVQDQPGQHGKAPSLMKIQKISWTW